FASPVRLAQFNAMQCGHSASRGSAGEVPESLDSMARHGAQSVSRTHDDRIIRSIEGQFTARCCAFDGIKKRGSPAGKNEFLVGGGVKPALCHAAAVALLYYDASSSHRSADLRSSAGTGFVRTRACEVEIEQRRAHALVRGLHEHIFFEVC